jgi:hypothetical protein
MEVSTARVSEKRQRGRERASDHSGGEERGKTDLEEEHHGSEEGVSDADQEW